MEDMTVKGLEGEKTEKKVKGARRFWLDRKERG
jgi:hypothetical protein